MANQIDSFDRILPFQDLLKGRARSALIWAIVVAVALFLALTCLLLLVGLFEHRGELELATVDEGQLKTASGYEAPSGSEKVLDSGLLPTVWNGRGRLPGIVSGTLFKAANAFRTNSPAATALSIALLILGLIWSAAVAANHRSSLSASREAADRLRKGIHRQAMRLAPSNLGRSGIDEALNLFVDRTEGVQSGLSRWLHVLTRDSAEVIAVAAFLLSIQWRLGLLCLIPVVVCLWVLNEIAKLYEQSDDLASDKAKTELQLLSESLQKSRLVRAYAMEDHEQTKFIETLDRYSEKAGDVARGQRMYRWFSQITILIVAMVILYLVLGERVLRTTGTRFPLADSVLIAGCLIYLTFPLSRLMGLRSLRREVSIQSGFVQRYLARIPEVGQAVGAKFLEPLTRVLQLDAVHYSDESGPLLRGLDLKVNAGETVAIVSINPAEARAVAYMIPRFIEPVSGRVLIDGEDIAWVTLESLRAEAIFVGGDEPFFTGSVLQNLTCNDPNYSLQNAHEAAKQAHAHNFVLELPSGYETQIGARGEQLTSGQAFRLSLARALLRKPALMVVEEPATSLNADDKALIEDAYARSMQDRTVIVLPTRLSTIKRADRVVLIHNGKIEAMGKQDKLVKSCGLYRHWEYTRFNEFRDAAANGQAERLS
ncbi:MAG: ABC transporter transmembrane domain-containing protein [Planctomycetaceae bacterium]